MFGFGETVTILTAGTRLNPYSGEQESTWDEPATEVVVAGCAVEPRPDANERVEVDRHAVVNGFTVYLPNHAIVTADSRLRVRGQVFDVLGEPAVWRSPFTGWAPGQIVQCGRTEG